MNQPTTSDLRSNLATWAIPTCRLPALGNLMHDLLPNEPFDPHFHGQHLQTTYFDTRKLELRKNRLLHDKYLTLRVRRYEPPAGPVAFSLSAKTEDEKFRRDLSPGAAGLLLQPGTDLLPVLAELLPANLYARLLEVSHADEGQILMPAVTIACLRYAVEDDRDRLTLDVDVCTDTDKHLPWAALEFKSTQPDPPPGSLLALGLRPIKLSKFLWALEV
jgi:hypothetical protein